MRWQAVVVVALVTAEGVLPQCLTEHNKGTQINTDLSGITDFGLDLYRKISPPSSPSTSNFFFSPYSIWTALALTYLGSNGNTKLELERVLRITDKTSTHRLLSSLKRIYRQRGNNPHYTFNVANRVYYDSNLRLRQCIRNMLPDEIRKANFSDTTGTAKSINNFVSNTTKGLIKEIISSSDLQNIVMVLVNAAYFKGTWVNQFNPSRTTKTSFYITPEDTISVDMMVLDAKLRYGESPELKARVLEVPYSGDDMSMVLLLPTEKGPQGFQNTVEALNGADLRTVLDTGLQETNVKLQLPKFKMEHTIKRQLIEALQNLGVRDLFNIGSADLSDFVLYTELYVSKAIHKAFVEVNEEGTEAAAATSITVGIRSGHSRQPISIPFRCNRPFLFLIHDKFTRNVVFFGAYTNPAS